MVTPVKTKAKVIVDNSGISSELPILITELGVLDPLLDYLLFHQHDRSGSWMERVVHATYLLMQYMETNQECFSAPKLLFQSFSQRLYTGTIDEYGFDPSGLYWLPSSTKTVNGLITALSGLTDFLSDKLGAINMNPLRKASPFEQRLNYAAWYRHNHHDFLGHIKDKTINETVSKARNVRGRRTLLTVHDDAIAFQETLFSRFYLEGMGGAKDIRVATRNQLILLMMHFAGCRESDCLQLWVDDVLVDPQDPNNVIVRLYHPEDGRAPGNWRSQNGSIHRAAYLREKYGLTPRNKLTGTKHVGWKYQVVDHKDNYIQLFWFPKQAAILFGKLWRNYCRYLTPVDRQHPYAFISFEESHAGKPLTINAFKDAYKKALYRIGKAPTKVEGLSPHGHRHAMGRRLERANLHPRIIQKVMHHSSLSSQEPYTAPGIERVNQALQAGYAALESNDITNKTKVVTPSWEELMKCGFDDIDLDRAFTGNFSKVRGRHK
ncbi:gamma-mobile-trio recombinase GmtY [Pseudoalteromonas sp. MMG005]|jgi:integrase|uniref:gamma-mobile-trio recombinase GmtY n=1 Tax=Pseudoalteromonas sp. MMG005 TaxID=2822682 RepID=UPI001B39EEEB|nr:gamma-mobile-trio recombinase GmtY [Pseudoalteromonas sp. MMG005]MBQ4848447.1 site-specific integrase [Pseudoalteromonas sp. MMG005]